jgi:hypothetical protein
MLNDLIRDFVLKLPDSIRSEICFRLVLFIDLGRLTPDDIEKVTGELLTPFGLIRPLPGVGARGGHPRLCVRYAV